jgi:hypothetical protein
MLPFSHAVVDDKFTGEWGVSFSARTIFGKCLTGAREKIPNKFH